MTCPIFEDLGCEHLVVTGIDCYDNSLAHLKEPIHRVRPLPEYSDNFFTYDWCSALEVPIKLRGIECGWCVWGKGYRAVKETYSKRHCTVYIYWSPSLGLILAVLKGIPVVC